MDEVISEKGYYNYSTLPARMPDTFSFGKLTDTKRIEILTDGLRPHQRQLFFDVLETLK